MAPANYRCRIRYADNIYCLFSSFIRRLLRISISAFDIVSRRACAAECGALIITATFAARHAHSL